MDDKIALLINLPLRTRPGFSLDACLSKIGSIIERAHRNIDPPFYRRLMGGVSKDHARAVVATCHADLTAILRVTLQIQNICKDMASSGDEATRHAGNALAGYCQRLIVATHDWSARASDFEANIFGSEKALLEQCQRLTRLHETLAKPVDNLSDW
ncbi:hypothetical protein HFO56_24355 [Rhizobium laguerreae]|uniref:hypothetical protein n=1 Tax=Rhizobium laguerreae TaxID=1076926 RepID=UPI001C92B85E|nr:hypothetical protein [Rhizobium laguerreae]MBY3155463.1 hypothetical protein [Rhizobium laguerreae]